mgnify:CR=1 FL=1
MLPNSNDPKFWFKLLESRQGGPLIQLALVGIGAGLLGIMALTLALYAGGVRLVEWAREQPSPYPAIDDRYFSQCARDAHELWQKANAYQALQNSAGLAAENAYQQWSGSSRRFARHCGSQNWPDQAVPQHPAEWLPYSGLTAQDWPRDIAAVDE